MELVTKITVEVLEKHAKWTRNEEGGERLISAAGKIEIDSNLSGANLSGADLSGADLSRANLSRANLSGADLRGVNLCDADLSGANLRGVNLCDADLCGANLRGVNLCDADLCGANLCGAKNLETVKANERTAFFAMQCPETGSFRAFKKCARGRIVELEIPADARRSSATTRKCRAEFADVIAVYDRDGMHVGEAVSEYDSTFVYRPGERVRPSNGWDENRWAECSSGIHFFITRREAEQYNG